MRGTQPGHQSDGRVRTSRDAGARRREESGRVRSSESAQGSVHVDYGRCMRDKPGESQRGTTVNAIFLPADQHRRTVPRGGGGGGGDGKAHLDGVKEVADDALGVRPFTERQLGQRGSRRRGRRPGRRRPRRRPAGLTATPARAAAAASCTLSPPPRGASGSAPQPTYMTLSNTSSRRVRPSVPSPRAAPAGRLGPSSDPPQQAPASTTTGGLMLGAVRLPMSLAVNRHVLKNSKLQ